MKVFVTRTIPEEGLRRLKEIAEVRVYSKDNIIPRKELEKGVQWADALLCLLTDKIDDKLLDLNPKLKIVANYAVGFDNINIKAASARGIPVANTPGASTDAVAEHTIALMMSIMRRIAEADKFVRAGKYKGWQPYLLLGSEVQGKTLGIIGTGRIGSGVARRAVKGLGMKLIYTDVQRNPELENNFGARFVPFGILLKESDVVSLHVPLLPSTRHLIGAEQLKMMKKTAYLINTARGPVIDEKALVSALKKKQIAGAGIDVYEFEPKLSPGLAKLDNVVLTPHTASSTMECRIDMARVAVDNVLAALRGERPPNCVNPEVFK